MMTAENETNTGPMPPPPPVSNNESITSEQRGWALGAHLSILAGALLTSQIGAIGAFAGPLIIWLMKKETMPFVDDQAKEALNFSLFITVINVIASLLILFTGVITLGLGLFITIPLFIAYAIAVLIFIIIAAVKANEGQKYRYPYLWRFIV